MVLVNSRRDYEKFIDLNPWFKLFTCGCPGAGHFMQYYVDEIDGPARSKKQVECVSISQRD